MVTVRDDASDDERAAAQARIAPVLPDLFAELRVSAAQVPLSEVLVLVVDQAAKREIERAVPIVLAEPGPRGLVYAIVDELGAELIEDIGLAPLEPGQGAALVAILGGVEVRARMTLQVPQAEAQA